MEQPNLTPKDIIPGKKYCLSGDIQNGRHADGTLRISHEEVCRKVSYIKDGIIVCECGRRFIINENLKIKLFQ